jgi:DNA-binding CsgD family transcriptional regulator
LASSRDTEPNRGGTAERVVSAPFGLVLLVGFGGAILLLTGVDLLQWIGGALVVGAAAAPLIRLPPPKGGTLAIDAAGGDDQRPITERTEADLLAVRDAIRRLNDVANSLSETEVRLREHRAPHAPGEANPTSLLGLQIETNRDLTALLKRLAERFAPPEPDFFATTRGESPSPSREQAAESLTSHEVEVLELLAQRKTRYGISRRLGMSQEDVKEHIAQILFKLGVTDRDEAVRVGIDLGLIEEPSEISEDEPSQISEQERPPQ